MRLRDLQAYFVGSYTEGEHVTHRRLESVEGAQGICFLCPKCFQANGGPVGTHGVLCWFTNPRNAPRVPEGAFPAPGRWEFAGESIDDITFTGPAAASVLITSGCMWHGFVKNGDAS